MRKIELTADDGETLTGQLPESWAEVPLAPYCQLAMAAQPFEDAPPIQAFCNAAAQHALAALLGVPAEPLIADLTIVYDLAQAEPWLFVGPLPEAEQVPGSFTHRGITYHHLGDLHDNAAGQLEALLTFTQQRENPLEVAHLLLAVLYAPAGSTKQTAASVASNAAALASLPMSIAWPALMGFMMRSLPFTEPIRKYGVVRQQAEQVVSALEKLTSPPSASPGRFSNMPHWLLSRLIQRVSNQLKTSSPRSVSIAAPRRSRRKGKRNK